MILSIYLWGLPIAFLVFAAFYAVKYGKGQHDGLSSVIATLIWTLGWPVGAALFVLGIPVGIGVWLAR